MKASGVSRMLRVLTTLQSGQRHTASDLAKILGTSRPNGFPGFE